MGVTYVEIELVRGDDLALERSGYLNADQINRISVLALVDSGASMLTIPRLLSQKLQLAKLDEVEAELADGSVMRADVVGPLEVRFQNRKTVVNAVVVDADTDTLLGAIPMQGMDVVIDPKREQLVVNPDSPDTARMLLK
ncbi:retroviral-like aspartic protease family protein [Oscillatoria sp. CS-180]|uniref:retroviral-like aspartic protease family protein n=1 Tax=Oscillatoria sp. CS-180 TaxID=3021720 RepID=UPI00232B2FDB|nr:retroviral-like aspartic protease family protein [Oscillatoria sp. CS-180]MDB9528716.1 retroviral-like aspartic protease family protein [Oscillatoria sp. CS-180]